MSWRQRSIALLTLAFSAIALATVLSAATRPPGSGIDVPFVVVTVLLGAAFVSMGALLLGVRTAGVLGPLFVVSGAALVLEMALRELVFDALSDGSAADLWARTLGWASSWLDVLGMPLALVLVLLLFPDGSLPSRRWRPVLVVALLVGALDLAVRLLAPGPWVLESHGLTVPWEGVLGWSRSTVDRVEEVLGVATIVLLGVAASAVAVRYLTGAPEVRRRLTPLLLAVATLVLGVVLQLVPGLEPAGVLVFVIGGVLVPVALAVGALRYRLWDLDPALVKTILYGALAVLVTVLDVVLVQAISLILGQELTTEVVLPTVAATVVVAVVFAPMKSRVERLVRRIVYGERATPYEALTSLPQRLVNAPTGEEVLPATAESLARGLGVEAAGVSVLLGSGDGSVSSWYPGPAAADRVVEAAEVRHLGARVGTLYIVAHPDQRLTRDDRRMLGDLAAQAGAALHAVALSAELARRLDQITLQAEELAESRRRLTVAHSQERLRLQRDLHDGVQQRLVAVAMRVGAARSQLGSGSGAVGEHLTAAESEVGASLDEIREIARGLHPSTLAARGLPAALRTRADVAQQPVAVVADELEGRRLPDEIEAAVYYSCLEALQNAAKHAPGSAVEIHLAVRDDQLTWSVSDDGPGFELTLTRAAGGIAGLQDRVAALRGRLDVESGDHGTTLRGTIPLAPELH